MPRTFFVHLQAKVVVTVTMPDDKPVSEADARLLASKLALARISASIDDPDAPEGDAHAEYHNECSQAAKDTSDTDWEAAHVEGVGAGWNLDPEAERNMNVDTV